MPISVVVPTYNRGAAVQTTLDSILAQTLAPLEIIVIDDGSTDGTANWIEAHYGAQVCLVRQDNRGVANARNRGLAQASGEYIAFCDHDDLWSPHKLEKQWEKTRQNHEFGVVYCYWREKNEQGEIVWADSLPPTQMISEIAGESIQASLVKDNVIISMSVPLIQTSLLRRVGGFDAKMTPCDDWDVWIKCSALKPFGCVPEVLVSYNRHSNQQSADDLAMCNATRRVMLKHWKRTCRHPRDFWVGITRAWFVKTVNPFYRQAQSAIRDARWKSLCFILLRCFFRYPFFFLMPQWAYVFMRLIKRDSRHF